METMAMEVHVNERFEDDLEVKEEEETEDEDDEFNYVPPPGENIFDLFSNYFGTGDIFGEAEETVPEGERVEVEEAVPVETEKSVVPENQAEDDYALKELDISSSTPLDPQPGDESSSNSQKSSDLLTFSDPYLHEKHKKANYQLIDISDYIAEKRKKISESGEAGLGFPEKEMQEKLNNYQRQMNEIRVTDQEILNNTVSIKDEENLNEVSNRKKRRLREGVESTRIDKKVSEVRQVEKDMLDRLSREPTRLRRAPTPFAREEPIREPTPEIEQLEIPESIQPSEVQPSPKEKEKEPEPSPSPVPISQNVSAEPIEPEINEVPPENRENREPPKKKRRWLDMVPIHLDGRNTAKELLRRELAGPSKNKMTEESAFKKARDLLEKTHKVVREPYIKHSPPINPAPPLKSCMVQKRKVGEPVGSPRKVMVGDDVDSYTTCSSNDTDAELGQYPWNEGLWWRKRRLLSKEKQEIKRIRKEKRKERLKLIDPEIDTFSDYPFHGPAPDHYVYKPPDPGYKYIKYERYTRYTEQSPYPPREPTPEPEMEFLDLTCPKMQQKFFDYNLFHGPRGWPQCFNLSLEELSEDFDYYTPIPGLLEKYEGRIIFGPVQKQQYTEEEWDALDEPENKRKKTPEFEKVVDINLDVDLEKPVEENIESVFSVRKRKNYFDIEDEERPSEQIFDEDELLKSPGYENSMHRADYIDERNSFESDEVLYESDLLHFDVFERESYDGFEMEDLEDEEEVDELKEMMKRLEGVLAKKMEKEAELEEVDEVEPMEEEVEKEAEIEDQEELEEDEFSGLGGPEEEERVKELEAELEKEHLLGPGELLEAELMKEMEEQIEEEHGEELEKELLKELDEPVEQVVVEEQWIDFDDLVQPEEEVEEDLFKNLGEEREEEEKREEEPKEQEKEEIHNESSPPIPEKRPEPLNQIEEDLLFGDPIPLDSSPISEGILDEPLLENSSLDLDRERSLSLETKKLLVMPEHEEQEEVQFEVDDLLGQYGMLEENSEGLVVDDEQEDLIPVEGAEQGMQVPVEEKETEKTPEPIEEPAQPEEPVATEPEIAPVEVEKLVKRGRGRPKKAKRKVIGARKVAPEPASEPAPEPIAEPTAEPADEPADEQVVEEESAGPSTEPKRKRRKDDVKPFIPSRPTRTKKLFLSKNNPVPRIRRGEGEETIPEPIRLTGVANTEDLGDGTSERFKKLPMAVQRFVDSDIPNNPTKEVNTETESGSNVVIKEELDDENWVIPDPILPHSRKSKKRQREEKAKQLMDEIKEEISDNYVGDDECRVVMEHVITIKEEVEDPDFQIITAKMKCDEKPVETEPETLPPKFIDHNALNKHVNLMTKTIWEGVNEVFMSDPAKFSQLLLTLVNDSEKRGRVFKFSATVDDRTSEFDPKLIELLASCPRVLTEEQTICLNYNSFSRSFREKASLNLMNHKITPVDLHKVIEKISAIKKSIREQTQSLPLQSGDGDCINATEKILLGHFIENVMKMAGLSQITWTTPTHVHRRLEMIYHGWKMFLLNGGFIRVLLALDRPDVKKMSDEFRKFCSDYVEDIQANYSKARDIYLMENEDILRKMQEKAGVSDEEIAVMDEDMRLESSSTHAQKCFNCSLNGTPVFFSKSDNLDTHNKLHESAQAECGPCYEEVHELELVYHRMIAHNNMKAGD